MAPRDAFRIALPNFEGPLDLLLHLIREHKVDILDIPIALITEKYLAHLEQMREINLDIAGEFLVMASTLLHLKSRMLLPREEVAAGRGELAQNKRLDPRAELVRRLLEYQKYKAPPEQLARQRPARSRRVPAPRADRPRAARPRRGRVWLKSRVYKLIEALDRVLKSARAEEAARGGARAPVAVGRDVTVIAEKLRRQAHDFVLLICSKARGCAAR